MKLVSIFFILVCVGCMHMKTPGEDIHFGKWKASALGLMKMELSLDSDYTFKLFCKDGLFKDNRTKGSSNAELMGKYKIDYSRKPIKLVLTVSDGDGNVLDDLICLLKFHGDHEMSFYPMFDNHVPGVFDFDDDAIRLRKYY